MGELCYPIRFLKKNLRILAVFMAANFLSENQNESLHESG